MPRSPYRRDLDNDIKRIMVRLTKPERSRIKATQARHGAFAPNISAMIRRGLELVCAELDAKEPMIGGK